MTQDILPAQPPRRGFIQVTVTAVVLILLTVVWKAWIGPWLIRYASVPDRALAIQHFRQIMAGFAALIALLAAFPAWMGWRIFRTGQFPLPGATVYRDTPILRGAAAKARGLVLLGCAALLLGCAVLACLIPGRLSRRDPGRSPQSSRGTMGATR